MTSLKQVTQRLLLSGLLAGGVLGAPKTAKAVEGKATDTTASQGQITALGSGEVRVRPDSFRTTIGFETRAATLEEARTKLNTKMQKIIRALKALSIPGLTLETTNLEFLPIYDDKTTPPKIIGFSATNAVSVTASAATARELSDRASLVVDAGLKSGANRIGDVSFFLVDMRTAERRALAAAVEDAAKNARVMAEASQVKIIKLKSLDQGNSFRPRALEVSELKTSMEIGTPIEIGEIVIRSTVTARFDFTK